MTKKKSDMTPNEIARVNAVAAACRARNRERINCRQKEKRRAQRDLRPQPTEAEIQAIKAEREAAKAAYKKEWAQRNAEHIRSYRRKKYAEDDSIRERSVKWNRTNKAARKAIAARYQSRNPEMRRAIKAKRRAAVRQAAGSFTKSDIKALFATQKGRCAVCRTKLGRNYEVDHIEPLARGGSNERTNLQLLCMPCNRSKGAKDPIEFMQQRGFLL